MTLRRIGLAAAAPVMVALAACGSVKGGAETSTSPVTSPVGSTSSAVPTQATVPASGAAGRTSAVPVAAGTRADKVFDRMAAATMSVTSLHVTSTISGALTIRSSGNEKLAKGKPVAFDLTATAGGSAPHRLILVNRKFYAKVPASVTNSGRPYLLLSTHSSNPRIRKLASAFAASDAGSSPAAYSVIAKAASKVTDRGPATVAGVATEHYSVVVIPAKLPRDFPNRALLARSGITSIPVELYVDRQARPVRVTEKLTVQGHAVAVVATFGNYNAPVSISAPPASQVTTG